MKQQLILGLALSIFSQPLWAAESVNENLQVANNERIYIENMRGEVQIIATGETRFKVSGTLDEKAEGYELSSKNGFTSFKVKMPTMSNYGNWGDQEKQGSRLQIEVPLGAQLEFQGVNASVRVSGVQGSTKVTTVNGSVYAEKLQQFIQLETVNGEITSVNNNGRITLNTVNGEIEDSGSQGRLSIEAVNGSIESKSSASEVAVSVVNGEADLELTNVQQLTMSSVNGELEAEVKGSLTPRIEASTVSGNAKLKLEKAVSAKFNLVANAGGSIKNELTSQKAERAKYGPRSSLEFSTGKGEGSVEMNTVSGLLKLETE
ncbi:hypothetical protein EIK76_14675 [Rheinheimera mesophila]|uniref:Adhesin domain-containing protein n=2 Tax=Rheinheimera mesophila TaxID=1547515 RepID=A0A3P3QFB8_9GAMM|nr:hypothetical protein SD53_13195 [Rheinheimera mesophila]RRJ19844.1 hypothetical protein EIK76_14675 [Rheinheimera mesophila]